MPKSKGRKKRTNHDLFLSERVLAKASIAVQELLQGAMSKASYQTIVSLARQKKTGYVFSDAKKKTKNKQAFPVLWHSSRGPAMRTKKGYTEFAR